MDSGSGDADGEGLDRHELLVAAGSGAPHEDGEAAGLVEHGQAVMPGVRLVGDTLLPGGDEGAHGRGVGTARRPVGPDNAPPAPATDRNAAPRGPFLTLHPP